MPIGVFNVERLNQNSQRSYPLTTWATKQDLTGSITIPDSFIVELQFPVHSGLDVQPEKFFIYSLEIYPTGYVITLGYDDGTPDPAIVAAANVTASLHTENRAYNLFGSGNFEDSIGTICIGKLDEIELLPPGNYRFDLTGAAMEVGAITPSTQGISSITVVNGSDRSAKLYGDIELVADTNFQIVASQVEGQPTQILFSAVEGQGLNETCVCDEQDTGPCIRTINGIPPLPDGNFRMIGDSCITITSITNGLQFSDECSQPCCGCDELNALIAQIDRFSDGVVTLQGYAGVVGVQVTQMSNVILGSQLNDGGCVEC